jgi:hypothetical protein
MIMISNSPCSIKTPLPLPPETHIGGGRPKGTTLEASRKLKKVKVQQLDSETKAWDAAKNENDHGGEILDGAGGPSRRCVGLGVLISEKTEKYQGLFPELDAEWAPPQRSTASMRLTRHSIELTRYNFEVGPFLGSVPSQSCTK